MAFLMLSLCSGLAGLAAGQDRITAIVHGIGAKIPFATVESPGIVPGETQFDPQVMLATLPISTGMSQPAAQSKKPAPGVVIFGPGGNGPDIDMSKIKTNVERIERPPVKESTLVQVRDSDELTGRR